MLNPFFTIIITLTDRMSYLFPLTLDSLLLQQGSSSFEVVIVDGTHGRVPLHHLPLGNVTVVSARSKNRFSMLNQALKIAKGQYVHCLNPGEFYLSKKALAFAMKVIQGYDFPDMMYTARIVRHSFGQPTVEMHPLSMNDLKGARGTANLQPFWFCRETLLMLGGFNEKFEIQGGYDLVCRYFRAHTLRISFVRRILTDYEYRKPPPKWILSQCLETFWISLNHFGLTPYLFVWLIQNCLRLFRFSWKIAHMSFWKQHAAY